MENFILLTSKDAFGCIQSSEKEIFSLCCNFHTNLNSSKELFLKKSSIYILDVKRFCQCWALPQI
jgi:hypothetical protein